MIIAGPCLYSELKQKKEIIDTAYALQGIVDFFRCKVFGGGTSVEKYKEGVGVAGIQDLLYIQDNILPVGTEIHVPGQITLCSDFSYLWVGARNVQNYSLLRILCDNYDRTIMLKRGPGMGIQDIINLYDIVRVKHKKRSWIIERGIQTFDKREDSRWSPDLKGVLILKQERPDIFESLIIDCSHSVGRKDLIKDTYKAFKAVGCRHFMFECTKSGKSHTDKNSMLSVGDLTNILK